MTDKEKFRKEVEKLKSNLIHGACSSQVAMETRCKEEAYNEVLDILDSLQEEPVATKVLGDMFNAKTAAESLGISQEEHDKIVDECLYGKEPELVDVDDLPVTSVWHGMSEEAENGRNIIIIDPKDFYGAVLRKGGSQLKNHNKERYVKWAYIDDLLKM